LKKLKEKLSKFWNNNFHFKLIQDFNTCLYGLS
jgi:hypothetical protein